MSSSIDVRGCLQGGILASIFRTFLTNESFFTTKVENTSLGVTGDALLAPSEPGGIALHHLVGQSLFLTSGAYLAADEGVRVGSTVQTRLDRSLLSGTGFFLLHAQGTGTLAIAAYGSIHKYELRAGERRKVDNGHLVSWTGGMNYSIGLASRRAGIVGSVTSGEGLHVEFEGPGTIYLQSHKMELEKESSRPRRGGSGTSSILAPLFVFLIFVLFVLGILLSSLYGGAARRKYGEYGQQHYDYNARRGVNDYAQQYQGGTGRRYVEL
jgi:uncharacterized protein (TIGR00266 family)